MYSLLSPGEDVSLTAAVGTEAAAADGAAAAAADGAAAAAAVAATSEKSNLAFEMTPPFDHPPLKNTSTTYIKSIIVT